MSQKALLLPVKQGNWEVGESPIPKPGPDEVLVKIVSAALNPVDWKIQVHGYFATEFPFISGTDAAGIVEEVGSAVTTRAKGDKIFFQGYFKNSHATFQQYCVVAAEITAKIPEKISFDQAASIPLGLATVTTSIWNHDPNGPFSGFPAPWEEGGLTKFAGKPVFIVGGSSSVGQYAIQMAKLSRHSPIITTASLKNTDLLKSLGATHVIDRQLSSDEILAEISKITSGTPIEYVYDAISLADTEPVAYQALAPGGVLVLVLPDVIPPEIKDKADGKKVVNAFGNVQVPHNRKLGVEMYSRLTEWLKTRVLVPNNVEVLPGGLSGIPAGLKRMEENKVSAVKLIARPQETA